MQLVVSTRGWRSSSSIARGHRSLTEGGRACEWCDGKRASPGADIAVRVRGGLSSSKASLSPGRLRSWHLPVCLEDVLLDSASSLLLLRQSSLQRVRHVTTVVVSDELDACGAHLVPRAADRRRSNTAHSTLHDERPQVELDAV